MNVADGKTDTGYVCMSVGDAFLEPKSSAIEHMKHFLSKLCVDRTKTCLIENSAW